MELLTGNLYENIFEKNEAKIMGNEMGSYPIEFLIKDTQSKNEFNE